MHPAEGRGAVFGGSGLICDFAVASAVLPVLTTAHRYDSHDTAPYGKLYPDFGGAVASFLLYVAELLDFRGLPIGIAASVFWFLTFWLVGRKWYERKEGQ